MASGSEPCTNVGSLLRTPARLRVGISYDCETLSTVIQAQGTIPLQLPVKPVQHTEKFLSVRCLHSHSGWMKQRQHAMFHVLTYSARISLTTSTNMLPQWLIKDMSLSGDQDASTLCLILNAYADTVMVD